MVWYSVEFLGFSRLTFLLPVLQIHVPLMKGGVVVLNISPQNLMLHGILINHGNPPPTNLCSGVPERSCGGSQVRGEVSTRGRFLGSAAHWLLSVGGGLFLFTSHKVVVGVVSVTLGDVGTCVRGLLLEATFKMALQGREVLKFR